MNTHFKTLLTILTVAVIGCGFVPQRAEAALITGSIDFGGVATFDTTSLATATRVSLWNVSFVLQSSGDFGAIVPGTSVTMATPWIFSPSTATPGLWSVGGFTFDLSGSVIVQQTSAFLNITGTGTISGNGFDPTPGTWSFTSSNSSGSNSSSFGFQAQSAAVPEAGSAVLVGIGAAGLFLGRRMLRKKAA